MTSRVRQATGRAALSSVTSAGLARVRQRLLPASRRLAWPLRYAGRAHECLCCGARLRRFATVNGVAEQCPRCLSWPRQRLMRLWFQQRSDLLAGPAKAVLHCAPEQSLMRFLREHANVDYTSVDLESPIADHHMDLTNLGFTSDSFDVIVCSHVLEHIDDDRAALRELRRVLKPGGVAVLQHPIRDVPETFEDASITAPEERLHHYGQADHVRMYGRDFTDRVAEASFNVEILTLERIASKAETERYGLWDATAPWISSGDLYVCS